jgi:hypothetical protein
LTTIGSGCDYLAHIDRLVVSVHLLDHPLSGLLVLDQTVRRPLVSSVADQQRNFSYASTLLVDMHDRIRTTPRNTILNWLLANRAHHDVFNRQRFVTYDRLRVSNSSETETTCLSQKRNKKAGIN